MITHIPYSIPTDMILSADTPCVRAIEDSEMGAILASAVSEKSLDIALETVSLLYPSSTQTN